MRRYALIVSYTFVGTLALISLVPVLWLVVSSLRPNGEFMQFSRFWPQQWTLENYMTALSKFKLSKYMFNSLVMSFGATLLNALAATMAAYIFARIRFKANEFLYGLVMAGMLIPTNALFVPTLIMARTLHLYDTLIILVLVNCTLNLPIAIFILRGFLSGIPREIEEAAMVDGCGGYRRFFRIVLPLLTPGIVTIGTLTFVFAWTEFMYGIILTQSEGTRTLQVAISFFRSQWSTQYTAMYAGIIISIVPSAIIFALFQKKIIEGLMMGAVKG